MIKQDFHGISLLDAQIQLHKLIDKIRLKGIPEDVELIVGHGVIRNQFIDILKLYGLTPSIQLGNSGVIVCVIE